MEVSCCKHLEPVHCLTLPCAHCERVRDMKPTIYDGEEMEVWLTCDSCGQVSMMTVHK